ncbi:MAG: oxidoreductase, partial [bacterium]
ALDFKRNDVEAMPSDSISVSFVNGAVRSSEQLEMVKLLRLKSQIIIAFGSCAHLGGIPGLANMFNAQDMFNEVYIRSPGVNNLEKVLPKNQTSVPQGELTLPTMWNTVKTLDQVIKVDYYLPGCPPPVKLIKDAVNTILKGNLPAKGAVLAPDIALCEECPHRDSKPEKLALREFRRPSEITVDEENCLLAQGLLCMGPVTRKGCGAACVVANMPCTGCMGPTSLVKDYGAKMLSAIASIVDSKNEKDIIDAFDNIADPVGTLYRYSLPASLIHRYYQAGIHKEDLHGP